MLEPDLFALPIRTVGPNHFDGETYDRKHDFKRLNKQLQIVFQTMQDGRWRSLYEISTLTGFPEQSVSARLRDLRKEKFGSHTVNRQRVTEGTFKYQLTVRT